MGRLLVRGEWYDQVHPESMYEADYEDLLLANAQHLYPTYAMCSFKVTVQSDVGNGRPDLALVDRQYRSWWVVEVELATHPLRTHVERQVAIFSRGAYGGEHVDALARCALDRERLEQMMRGLPPRAIVLVDRIEPDWPAALARYDALIEQVQVYRSSRNELVLRMDGERAISQDPESFLSICRRDRLLPTFLKVDSPASIPAYEGALRIVVDGSITEWMRRDTDGGCWLVPLTRYALVEEHSVFQLHSTREGTLVLNIRR